MILVFGCGMEEATISVVCIVDHQYLRRKCPQGDGPSRMTESNELVCSPVSHMQSEPSLDSAPLELTVTTSITSLTPVSTSGESTMSTSPATTPGKAPSSEECSIMDVGAMVETGSMSPKSETENDMGHHDHDHDHHDLLLHCQPLQSCASRLASPNNALVASDAQIKAGARFVSYADFEHIFEMWKAKNFHPFRVASSETLRLPDGSTNATFKYRYIVFHCAHYGAPRKRGVGKRPNQNYMPCGCKAMLRLNYSWSENALRVTTLHEEHVGHEVTEDAYYKFAAKAKQRQSSSSPPAVNGLLPSPHHLLSVKRQRSESPYSNVSSPHQPPNKMMKNGHATPTEAPLNLSKNGFGNGHVQTTRRSGPAAMLPPIKAEQLTQPTPALSVLMFNHQQQAQHQQQQAYNELIRLLSVNGGGGPGLVTALGASGVRDCRTESDRHRLIYPIMQTMTQHLATARGFEFDEKLRDLKAVLKKWQLLPQAPTTPIVTSPAPNFVNRSSSAAAAAAAMMVQAMSAGGGNGFPMANGNGSSNGLLTNGR